ncbi:hypothetical protein SLE2022_310700 [Rubroshorea leprosula]
MCVCLEDVDGVLCMVEYIHCFSKGVSNHFRQHEGPINQRTVRDVLKVVWFAGLWSLWKWRNQKVSGTQMAKEEEVMDLIKYRYFFWLKAKGYSKLDFETGKINPRQAISVLKEVGV